GLKFIISVDYNKFKDVFRDRKKRRQQREAQQKEIERRDTQATTSNTGKGNEKLISNADRLIADDRKSVPASVKDSTDGN
ncbi:MAG TPA: hypothetical protein VF540_07195, partial [Segetibacter sp.]